MSIEKKSIQDKIIVHELFLEANDFPILTQSCPLEKWYLERHLLMKLWQDSICINPQMVLNSCFNTQRGSFENAWSLLFRRPVELIRQHLSKFKVSSSLPDSSGTNTTLVKSNNVNEHSIYFIADFLLIIEEGLGFYLSIDNLLSTIDQNLVLKNDSKLLKNLRRICLVRLADLIRYRIIIFPETDNSKNLGQAKFFLTRAKELDPGCGHIYNQYAVICGMSDNISEAMFFYTRASISIEPFSRATDNLIFVSRRIIDSGGRRMVGSDPKKPISPLQAAIIKFAAHSIIDSLILGGNRSNAQLQSLFNLTKHCTTCSLGNEDYMIPFSIMLMIFLVTQRNSKIDHSKRTMSPSQLTMIDGVFTFCTKADLPNYFKIIFGIWIFKLKIIDRLIASMMRLTHNFIKAEKKLVTLAEDLKHLENYDLNKMKTLLDLFNGTIIFEDVSLQSISEIKRDVILEIRNFSMLVSHRSKDISRPLVHLSEAESWPTDVTFILSDAEFLVSNFDVFETIYLSAKHDNQSEPLNGQRRWIVPLAVLQALDVWKGGPRNQKKSILSRKIIRLLSNIEPDNSHSFVRLQKPNETDESLILMKTSSNQFDHKNSLMKLNSFMKCVSFFKRFCPNLRVYLNDQAYIDKFGTIGWNYEMMFV